MADSDESVLSFKIERGLRVLPVLDSFHSVAASLVSDSDSEVCNYIMSS